MRIYPRWHQRYGRLSSHLAERHFGKHRPSDLESRIFVLPSQTSRIQDTVKLCKLIGTGFLQPYTNNLHISLVAIVSRQQGVNRATAHAAGNPSLLIYCTRVWSFHNGGGGYSHIKVTGMLRGINCRFWSHLGCLGRKVTTFAHSGIA